MPVRRLIPLSLIAASAACTLGPQYQHPTDRLENRWIAQVPGQAVAVGLKVGWESLHDPILLELQSRAARNSPSVDQAVARILQARATLSSDRSSMAPALNGAIAYSQAGQTVAGSVFGAQTATGGKQGSLDASWEVDLFGKYRRTVQGAKAKVEARAADLADAHLSLTAEVADLYIQYRGCEILEEIYVGQARSQQDTARFTRASASAGFTAPAEADLADAAAASMRSSLLDQQGQCDVLLKSLVSLTASGEPELRRLLRGRTRQLPRPGLMDLAKVPADLLRRRPDIVSQERELAAASAGIGVAVADLYPSLSLSGSVSASDAIRQWSFGPSLSLPLFDAGRRRANLRSAHAAFDLQLATYRQTVREAVLDVEQALVRLAVARDREQDAARAAAGYAANFQAAIRQFEAGSTNMLDRETARRNALDAQISLASLRTMSVRYWIALYKAAGGGWSENAGPESSLPASRSPAP